MLYSQQRRMEHTIDSCLRLQKPVLSPDGVQSIHSYACCSSYMYTHIGNAFPQPPTGIHVTFGFVEETAELELQVWVDKPSTGE